MPLIRHLQVTRKLAGSHALRWASNTRAVRSGQSAGSAAIFEPSRHLQAAGGVKSHLVALYVDQQVTHSVTHQHGHEPVQVYVSGPEYNHFDLINEAIFGECQVRGVLRYSYWAFSNRRSASMTADSGDPSASFARRYRLPIALGVLMLVAVIVTLRLLLNYFGERPIVEPFKSYIEQLADASPEARSELQRYLAASARDSVASRDFLPLCKRMLRQVLAQGADVRGEIFALCKERLNPK